jgi:hypothetical protein
MYIIYLCLAARLRTTSLVVVRCRNTLDLGFEATGGEDRELAGPFLGVRDLPGGDLVGLCGQTGLGRSRVDGDVAQAARVRARR